MQATVVDDRAMGQMVNVHIRNDPFPTYVDHEQLELKEAPVPTTKTGARELRTKAKNLVGTDREIPEWELMSREDLAAAVAEAEDGADEAEEPTQSVEHRSRVRDVIEDSEDGAAKPKPKKRRPTKGKQVPTTKKRTAKRTTKKRATKKAPATKKTTKRAAPRPPAEYEGPNPYRPGTNLYHLTEALMKGGKRSVLVKQLKKKLEFNPRSKTPKQFDVDEEIDRRLKVVGYILRKDFGFALQHDGRGPDAFIKATPPR